MTRNKDVSISAMKKAINMSYKKALPEKDEDAIYDEIMAKLEQRTGQQNPTEKIAETHNPEQLERKTMRPNRKKRNFFTTVMAATACALICTLVITGGMMNSLKTATHTTDPGTQSTTTEDRPNTDGNQVQETIRTSTERAVEYKGPDASEVETGEVILYGGSGKGNSTNPTTIALEKADIKSGTCKWTIKTYKTQKAVYSGTGSEITTQLKKLLKSEKNGNYTVTFAYEDVAGNKIEVFGAFTINADKL